MCANRIIFSALPVCALTLLLYSCSGKQEENSGTLLIDSLVTSIAEAEKKVENINFAQAETNRDIASEQMNFVMDHLDDTVYINNNLLLKNYRQFVLSGNDKSNYTDSQRKLYILKELKYSKKQLKNLKADFLNGHLNLKEFENFLQVEKQKSVQIVSFVVKEQEIIEKNLSTFDSVNSHITLLVDSLKNIGIKE